MRHKLRENILPPILLQSIKYRDSLNSMGSIMAVCMTCGTDYAARGEMLDVGGTKYKVCGDCAQKAKMDPAQFIANVKKLGEINPSFPVCDACGRRHSSRCDIVKFAGVDFNVCGYCIPEVAENPADFLAGKKGTEPEV
jgi:ribosome-binding protein aMBF1 (putative translation factor)